MVLRSASIMTSVPVNERPSDASRRIVESSRTLSCSTESVAGEARESEARAETWSDMLLRAIEPQKAKRR